MTSLSLIICTYRRPNEIDRLLGAIAHAAERPSETLVVDASSDVETEKVVDRLVAMDFLPGLRYVRVLPEHRGLTRQRNFGIDRVSGAWIAFLDDDTIPESNYFTHLLASTISNPDAVGIGGCITNDVQWVPSAGCKRSISVFRCNGWERREAFRWRLRRCLGLASKQLPGFMPPSGHGRPPGYPPDGKDYQVEYIMGGVSCWHRTLFEKVRFGEFFAGYGLYEDMDFCIRAGRHGPIYLCTKARVAHYHAPSGRPNQFRYGWMVVRNGWYVWRQRWPEPGCKGQIGWWATTALLAFCRLANTATGPRRRAAFTEAMGRIFAMACTAFYPPRLE